MVVTGAALGRESYGTRVLVTVGGVKIEFPGEITGLAESPPSAAGQRPNVIRHASGRTDVVDQAQLQEEPKTLTLNYNIDPSMLAYQRIAMLEGQDTRLSIEVVEDELPYHTATPAGSTVAIAANFGLTFAGDDHPSNVKPGAAIKIGGHDYKVARFTGASADHSGRFDTNDPVLDKAGLTAGGAYKSEITDSNIALSNAVDAAVYLLVIPATTTGLFEAIVRSAPRLGDWSSAERGTKKTGSIVLEMADGADIPFPRLTNLAQVD